MRIHSSKYVAIVFALALGLGVGTWTSDLLAQRVRINGVGQGVGTVTSLSIVTANGVSGTCATATTTPACTFTLGAITPTTVNGITITDLAPKASPAFTGQVTIPSGTFSAPGIGFSVEPGTGMYWPGASNLELVVSQNRVLALSQNAGVTLYSGLSFRFASSGTTANLAIGPLASANLRLGFPANATPVANILTIGEASIPGTSSNTGGGNGTIECGLGTGTGTPCSLIFRTPVAVGSGTGVQTQTTQFTLSSAGGLFTVPVNSTSYRLGAASGSLMISSTAPTIASACGTSPSVSGNNGTAAFTITIGSGGTDQTCVITMPAAAAGWAADATDVTSNSTRVVSQTASSTTSITLQSYSRTTGLGAAFGAADVIAVKAIAW